MKKIVLSPLKIVVFLATFVFLQANTLSILPAYNNTILITNDFTIKFLKHIKLKNLKTIKYFQQDLITDTNNICSKKDIRKKIESGRYFYHLATNYNATQIALIQFKSCTDIKQNTLYIVDNRKYVNDDNLFVFFANIPIDKTYVVDQTKFIKTINKLCSNKNARTIIEKHPVIYFYSDKNAKAFIIEYINTCPAY